VLILDNLTKSFAVRKVLDGVSWSMTDGARVGLVGLNGAGKSTLLKMIGGLTAPDSGRISRPQRTRVGYLAQDAPDMRGRTVLQETLSALDRMQALDARRRELEQTLEREHSGPAHETALAELGDVLHELERHGFYEAESRAESVLFGLGFSRDDLARDVAEFSGGIRMRIALAKLLLDAPEFLMLDEPTNHLDLEARNWLEDYLADYPGGIIVVSHDRYFLDRVTGKTLELARAKLTEYQGGYSRYLVQRDERYALELAAYEKQREEIEHIESFISRFRYQASKAKLVQSRVKQLEKIERLQPPPGAEKPPAIMFPEAARSPRRVFELKGAVKRYDDLTVYAGIDLTIERGQKIALVGPNGAGKSTMLKLLAAVEPLTAGERYAGDKVTAGYFAQNLADSLDYSKTVIQELSDNAPALNNLALRGLLGAMLFSGDDVDKRVGVLSGGERARLALAKVLAQRNNVLLLDEPTNNLDIIAKDTLLEALRRFPGTVILVSHDRFILNELASEVLEVGQGHATRYLGNYDQYLEKKAAMESAADAAANGARPPRVHEDLTRHAWRDTAGRERGHPEAQAQKAAPQNNKDEDRERRRRADRAAKERSKLEADIESKETERASLAGEMNDPEFYLKRKDADQLIERYEKLGREIERLYSELVKFEQSGVRASQ